MAPLAAAAAFGPEALDEFWIELGSATGLTAGAMLLLQFLSSGRFESIAGRVGLDVTIGFHRFAAAAVLLAALLHPLAFAAAGAENPGSALARLWHLLAAPSLLTGTLALLTLLALLSLAWGRQRLALPYQIWRAGHGLLAALAVLLLADHALRHGSYLLSHPVTMSVGAALAMLALASLTEVWVLRAIRARHQGWRVEAVRPLAPKLWEVILRQRHGQPFHFEAGQFAWVVFGGRHPLNDNPFSIASAPAEWPDLRLVIREAGDMTGNVGALAPGTPAALDGPHGALTVQGRTADAILLVAGGVGIAPIIGILRSLAAKGEPRPVRVLVATRSTAEQVFHEETAGLAARLDLRAEHLVQAPPPAGAASPAFAGPLATLLRGLEPGRTLALLCGPAAMMEAVAGELERQGLPDANIRYERFDYGAPHDRHGRSMRRAFLLVLTGVACGALAFALRGLAGGAATG
ncbi:ferric reductase-like transmembrane domain-containing protein [Roseomonas sp. E05]|uniref:ferric reductase-like transmembrane domain-containing protein n=1 Tax=Roseomonas sp. E05 TaxID=3046310 RepID=UPI0024BA3840|nr:ferric reductase-like transmembrane domain-containing protein [Roseomonas sp. E05]MDJ0387624.1 ferric reductase-like transmembrane domain-containing protein [Roseomonas sp. E05]